MLRNGLLPNDGSGSGFPVCAQRQAAGACGCKQSQYRIDSLPPKGFIRLTKSLRLAGHLPGLTPISADISHASLEVIGLPGVESLIEVHSKADAPDQW